MLCITHGRLGTRGKELVETYENGHSLSPSPTPQPASLLCAPQNIHKFPLMCLLPVSCVVCEDVYSHDPCQLGLFQREQSPCSQDKNSPGPFSPECSSLLASCSGREGASSRLACVAACLLCRGGHVQQGPASRGSPLSAEQALPAGTT